MSGGLPTYHPEMIVLCLLYAYCVGMPSSRQIEKACKEVIPFRVLTANGSPDHDTIAQFRRRRLKPFAGFFVQVCAFVKAGLVKLGHVALDGTKVKANASKHKAMSYGRMQKGVAELEEEVRRLLGEAEEATDEVEDQRYGKGQRGDELPEELRFKQARLAKIKEAKEALEREARERAEAQRREQEEKKSRRVHLVAGRPSPSEEPPPRRSATLPMRIRAL